MKNKAKRTGIKMNSKNLWNQSELDYFNSKIYFSFTIENLWMQSKITDTVKKEKKFYQLQGKASDKALEGIETVFYLTNDPIDAQKELGLGAFYLSETNDKKVIVAVIIAHNNIYDEIFKCFEIGKMFNRDTLLILGTNHNFFSFSDIVYDSTDSNFDKKFKPIFSVEICNR